MIHKATTSAAVAQCRTIVTGSYRNTCVCTGCVKVGCRMLTSICCRRERRFGGNDQCPYPVGAGSTASSGTRSFNVRPATTDQHLDRHCHLAIWRLILSQPRVDFLAHRGSICCIECVVRLRDLPDSFFDRCPV